MLSSRANLLLALIILFLFSNITIAQSGKAGIIDTQAVDLYWVSFGGDHPTDGVFLMQIDLNGKVIKKPKLVISASQIGSTPGSTALGKGSNGSLNLWRSGAGGAIYRAVIRPSTLTTIKFTKLPLTNSDEDIVEASQKANGNFLCVETGASVLKGFGVTAGGTLTGKKWNLISGAPNQNDEASLSADGLLATSVRYVPNSTIADSLYIQKLKTNGTPNGAAKKIVSFTDIESTDSTNVLPSGKRFIVYNVVAGASGPNTLFLQNVNGSTGAKLGSAIQVNRSPLRDEEEQVVAIDPLGRFLLLTVEGTSFGCPDRDILAYQKLTVSGAASGSLKVIAGCTFVSDDILGIDILKQ